ncbi:hypothetical protein ASPZODRAFT_136175 [Penicilliopsis zonata CBS 506.65]|uniref:Uncharacterized protein n=1 Tax=Penicilliopsis zonata CBS 506.65 TaxID=1073090 RepID=A0A1L9S851_9EURO|nr:hypothetical protein ASPZODRAFT_136175 [Penicilliopsis zonata CBS 506.65]OJJ43332.1 hypothetical protein ASPZODRAFT_136175 [Penicilliopsis zonata CBS 506.65]
MDFQQAQNDTQEAVDVMILDYLLCLALNALLRARIADRLERPHSLDAAGAISLAYSFERIISTRIADARLPSDLELKRYILGFADKLLCRYTHPELRQQQANLYPSHDPHDELSSTHVPEETTAEEMSSQNRDEPMTNSEALDANYKQMLLQMKIPSSNNKACPRRLIRPLSDMVPDILKLCELASPWLSITQRLEVTTGFMKQASLERCRIFGDTPMEAKNKCSTRTFGEHKPDSTTGTPELATRSHDLVYTTEFLNLLQLGEIPENPSLFQFEGLLINVLLEIIEALDAPVLLQLEMGSLDGLSHTETAELKAQSGL